MILCAAAGDVVVGDMVDNSALTAFTATAASGDITFGDVGTIEDTDGQYLSTVTLSASGGATITGSGTIYGDSTDGQSWRG